MAAALLAGSFSVVAQTTTEWVPVTPDQLVNGAEYVIHNGDHSYSVIEGTAGNKSGMPYTDDQNCPLFGIPKADSDSIWTLTKVAGGFTLQSDAENLFPIYLANKGLYTNISNSDLAVFTLGNDSTLSVTVDGTVNYVVAPSKKTGTTGFMVNEKKENALKFAFFMKQDIPSDVTEDVIVANTPTLATTMYVIFDGKYVGLPSTSTKAVGEGLEAYNDPNESCLWIYENGTLQNLQDRSIYLTVGANGNVVASDKAVKVSYDGTVLSVDGVNANVSLANTDEPLPLQGEVDYAEKGSTSIVLFHDGKALSAEGGFVSYVPNNSASTVWSLQAVETTKGVYEVSDKLEKKFSNVDELVKGLELGDDALIEKNMVNGLQNAAIYILPEIQNIIDKLHALNFKKVMMSGSGSSVFALSEDFNKIKKAAKEFDETLFSIWITKTICPINKK